MQQMMLQFLVLFCFAFYTLTASAVTLTLRLPLSVFCLLWSTVLLSAPRCSADTVCVGDSETAAADYCPLMLLEGRPHSLFTAPELIRGGSTDLAHPRERDWQGTVWKYLKLKCMDVLLEMSTYCKFFF